MDKFLKVCLLSASAFAYRQNCFKVGNNTCAESIYTEMEGTMAKFMFRHTHNVSTWSDSGEYGFQFRLDFNVKNEQ